MSIPAPWRPGRGRRASLGFTLIEIILVVGIIAMAMSLAFWTVAAQQRKVHVTRFAREFKTRVEVARTLAASVGARLGTSQFQNCGEPADSALAIAVDPGANTYTVPVRLEFLESGVMSSVCEIVDVGRETGGRLALKTADGDPLSFAFQPSGRLQAPAAVFVGFELRREDGTVEPLKGGLGFRVLPSGVVCPATSATGPLCEEDRS